MSSINRPDNNQRETHVVSNSTLVRFEMSGGRHGQAYVQNPIKLRLQYDGVRWLCYADTPVIAIARHSCRESVIQLCLEHMMRTNVNLQEHRMHSSDQDIETRRRLEDAFYGLQMEKR